MFIWDAGRRRHRGAVFDFFGTLVEVDEDRPTMAETLAGLGYRCGPAIELIFNSDGHNGRRTPTGTAYDAWRRDQILRLCAFIGVEEPRKAGLVDDLLAIDREWTVRARPGARQVLDAARSAGIAIAIASNWDYPLGPYLEQASLPTDMLALTSRDIGYRKPDPRILLDACASIGVEPGAAVYVGDTWASDVVAAVRAGMTPIWLTNDSTPACGHVLAVPGLKELIIGDGR